MKRRGYSDRPILRQQTGFRGLGEQIDFERYRKKRRRQSWLALAPVWIAAALLGTAYGAGWLDRPLAAVEAGVPHSGGTRAHFSMCFIGGGYNCVVDGDTIWLAGTKIRIADIDAPETHPPRCAFEKDLGERATIRLRELLNNGVVTLQPIDRDRDHYGRKLRIVRVDGRSVGDILVSEGLARWYAGGRRPWC